MSPPPLGVEGDEVGNVSLMTSTSSVESNFQKSTELMEQNYLGLPDCSSVDSSDVSSISEVNRNNLNLKATELRLGLPGSLSPEKDPQISVASSKKPLFSLLPSKDGICLSLQKTVSGNKRGFSNTMDGCSEIKGFSEGNWMFYASETEFGASKSLTQGNISYNTNADVMMPSRAQLAMSKEKALEVPQDWSHTTDGTTLHKADGSDPPAVKTQIVGWPPVRSFCKNIRATVSRNSDEVDGKPGPGTLFVKVSMDGAPYLRKINLSSYSTYQELSSALEKMFSCFAIGQCVFQGACGRESLSESKLRDLLHGSGYVLTYEDKDGDWMLVGDVPWDMFIGSCKRLKIMKGSDAIGLACQGHEKIEEQKRASAR